MNLLFMGASGSGKGTQAKLLKEKYNLYHISMGNLFREAKEKGLKSGLKADEYIKNGNLVPLELTASVLYDELKSVKQGVILDGFPRTLEQVQVFKFPIDAVIYFKNDNQKLMNRLLARRTCIKCGNIYSIGELNNEQCPNCGEVLTIRNDDNETSIKKRIAFFENETLPAIEYYRQKNLVFEVDADLSKEQVFDQIDAVVKKLIK